MKAEKQHKVLQAGLIQPKQERSKLGFVDNRPQAVSQTKLIQSIQKKEYKTGLPDNLKTGVENLSGFSMDDVRVHYNSNKPAQLYAQGTDIHVAFGQEKLLPHEVWHVVQKQRRVQPAVQMQGMNVNDNEGFGREADVMGEYGRKQQKQESRAIAYNGGGSRQLKEIVDNDANSIIQTKMKDEVAQCALSDKGHPAAKTLYISALQTVANSIIEGATITPELIATLGGQEYDLNDDDKVASFFDILASSAGAEDIRFKKAEILFDMVGNANEDGGFAHTVSTNDESNAFEGAVDHKIKNYDGQNYIWIESIVSLASGVGGSLITNVKELLGKAETAYVDINQIWLAAYAGSGAYYTHQGFVKKENLYYDEEDCSINQKTEDTAIDGLDTFDIYTFTKA